MKYLTILCLTFLMVGCSKPPIVDGCKKEQVFFQCMAALPAGPTSTKYNDWDEVVEECGNQAYYLSLREEENVAPECR